MKAALLISIIGLTLAGASSASAGVRALLVGIGDYPTSSGPGFAPLEGPPNDVQLFRNWLVNHVEVPEDQVLLLRDADATSQGIQQAFRRHLIQECQPDDVAVFFFAGHGTQLDEVGPETDEPDNQDEALVTYDFSAQDTATWLTDDIIHNLLKAVPARHVLVVFDCCHSGTGTRGLTRGGNNPFKWAASRSAVRPDTQMWENSAGENQVFIAACGDGELAYQMYDPDLSAKTGVLTHMFCDLAASSVKDEPLDAFQDRLRAKVDQEVKRQAEYNKQNPVVAAKRRNFSLASFLRGEPFGGGGGNVDPVPPPAPDPGLQNGFTPTGDLEVTLNTNKSNFVWTETLSATASVDQPAYLRIVYVDAEGHQTQLYPNRLQPQRLLRAGETVSIPPAGRELRITAPTQGLEMLVAVACTKPFQDKEASDFAAGIFNALPDAPVAQSMHRGVVVEARPESGSPGTSGNNGVTAVGQAIRIFRVSQF